MKIYLIGYHFNLLHYVFAIDFYRRLDIFYLFDDSLSQLNRSRYWTLYNEMLFLYWNILIELVCSFSR